MSDAGTPVVSVVIAVFNGAAHLGEQLAALADQRLGGPFEVIVADNGSTDDSTAVSESYASQLTLRVIDASDRRGQAHARNAGARAARAPLLVFLDQDDVVASGYLAAMVHALDDAELVGARMETSRLNPGWIAQARRVAQTTGLAPGAFNWVYGSTLGVRKSVFGAIGGFDESLSIGGGEDIDFCFAAQLAGARLAFVDDAVLHYRYPGTYGELFRQGRRYGCAQIPVNRKHAGILSRERPLTEFRRLAGTLWLLITARHRGDRGYAWFLLGRRTGLAEGRVRAMMSRKPR